MGLARQLVSLARYRQALWLLTLRDLRQRVTGTLLGPLWLVLQPLFLLLVYTFVFGLVLKVRFRPEADTFSFALYLMAGLLPFNAFQETVQRSTGILTANRDLIQRSVFPAALLPAMPALGTLFTETIGLLLLIVATAVITGNISSSLWMLPLLIVIRLLLSLGVAWIMSVLAVFIRDLGQLVGTLLILTFFATPILYPIEMVPANWRWVQDFNPFYHLVQAYRDVILESAVPSLGTLVLALLTTGLALLGLALFGRLLPRAKDFL